MTQPDNWQVRLREAKTHAKRELGGIEGVQGFGVGDRCLRIYVRSASVRRELPDTFEDWPVECVEVGEIVPQDP